MGRHATRKQGPSAFTSADPPRNFSLTTEERVRAIAIGVPAYAERKRRIEDAEDRWVATLVATHDARRARGASEGEVLAAVRAKAETFDFGRVNALVAAHNRNFPVEANLPSDPQTGGYLAFGRPWSPEPPFDAERVLRAMRDAIDAREQELDGGQDER